MKAIGEVLFNPWSGLSIPDIRFPEAPFGRLRLLTLNAFGVSDVPLDAYNEAPFGRLRLLTLNAFGVGDVPLDAYNVSM